MYFYYYGYGGSEDEDAGELSLYFDTDPGQLADLEVSASAAIQWAQALKAAAVVVDPNCEYRISLVAARPGSSNWIARIERSKINHASERLTRGWKKVPAILRIGIGLAVVIPTTAKPTYDYWLGDDGFSETQLKQLKDIHSAAENDDAVKAHKKAMYKATLRDKKITGIGTGIPTSEDWKPTAMVPANQFAEAEGLFEAQREVDDERTVSQTLDVILVTPRLENAPRVWVFRQEGLAGTISATMKDKAFLAALERSAVRESFRLNIPMTIRLEIKQHRVNGEWKVKRQGRSVAEVISPLVE